MPSAPPSPEAHPHWRTSTLRARRAPTAAPVTRCFSIGWRTPAGPGGSRGSERWRPQGTGVSDDEPATGVPSETAAPSRSRLRSHELFRGRREIVILHAGHEYVLRITKMGKLILTK